MNQPAAVLFTCLLGTGLPALAGRVVFAEKPPLLPETTVAALAQQLSGEAAKRNLEFLARLHRTRGSRPFHAAAEYVVSQARAYGLSDAHIEQFPADGKAFYGTQKSRLPWDAEFAELWELRFEHGQWVPAERVASWDAMPITLAEDSESAEVSADLVDVGEGAAESDYAGKEVRGKLVLASAQADAVERIAVESLGAAGIVSYAQNQPTAWWGEDENLIRWGHLESFPATPTFAFMVSLKRARDFRRRLARGETVRLRASVRAGRHPGFYEVATATIPGADPRLREEEIVFSCHLDHQLPGANDNASGCATILEVARTVEKLIEEGKLARSARTLRFVWPPEIEGTLALLNARPELAAGIKAVVHMDMVGGGPVTKAVFHITRSPASLPSFVNDVAEAFGEFVNRETESFASTGSAAYPLVAAEGGKEALRAELVDFTPGSDHEIYAEGSWRIPAIYLNDWPDRYIHTNFDSPSNIDPTKLKRAAFIGAASGYFLASMGPGDVAAVWQVLRANALRRDSTALRRSAELAADGGQPDEAANLLRFHFAYESALVDSIERFEPLPTALRVQASGFFAGLEKAIGETAPGKSASGDGQVIFRRNADLKGSPRGFSPRGPMAVFAYDFFTDHYGAERSDRIRLLHFQGRRASGSDYAYEVLNLVDGRRNAQQIRDDLSAICGPVALDVILEYLRALESIGVLRSGP